MHIIRATLFSAAASLNAFWILNIAKEAYPSVKAFLNFYPVTGPLLGLYGASIVVFIVSFAVVWGIRLMHARVSPNLLEWYFAVSVIVFFFAVFPPVYEPVARLLSGA